MHCIPFLLRFCRVDLHIVFLDLQKLTKGVTVHMEHDVFEQAVDVLCDNIKGRMSEITEHVKHTAIEIRMRTGLPLMINTLSEPVFLLKNGGVT